MHPVLGTSSALRVISLESSSRACAYIHLRFPHTTSPTPLKRPTSYVYHIARPRRQQINVGMVTTVICRVFDEKNGLEQAKIVCYLERLIIEHMRSRNHLCSRRRWTGIDADGAQPSTPAAYMQDVVCRRDQAKPNMTTTSKCQLPTRPFARRFSAATLSSDFHFRLQSFLLAFLLNAFTTHRKAVDDNRELCKHRPKCCKQL